MINRYRPPVEIEHVKLMIRDHVSRIKSAGVNLSHEHIGVIISGDEMKVFFDTHRAANLLALFCVERHTTPEEKYTTTVTIMPLDASGTPIKDRGSYLAAEKWPEFTHPEVRDVRAVDSDHTCLDRLFT